MKGTPFLLPHLDEQKGSLPSLVNRKSSLYIADGKLFSEFEDAVRWPSQIYIGVGTNEGGHAVCPAPGQESEAVRDASRLASMACKHAELRERLLKEAVHELGHTLDLTHCDDYRCAMSASHSVELIDLKENERKATGITSMMGTIGGRPSVFAIASNSDDCGCASPFSNRTPAFHFSIAGLEARPRYQIVPYALEASKMTAALARNARLGDVGRRGQSHFEAAVGLVRETQANLRKLRV